MFLRGKNLKNKKQYITLPVKLCSIIVLHPAAILQPLEQSFLNGFLPGFPGGKIQTNKHLLSGLQNTKNSINIKVGQVTVYILYCPIFCIYNISLASGLFTCKQVLCFNQIICSVYAWLLWNKSYNRNKNRIHSTSH